jgi:hypothetical protein
MNGEESMERYEDELDWILRPELLIHNLVTSYQRVFHLDLEAPAIPLANRAAPCSP